MWHSRHAVHEGRLSVFNSKNARGGEETVVQQRAEASGRERLMQLVGIGRCVWCLALVRL